MTLQNFEEHHSQSCLGLGNAVTSTLWEYRLKVTLALGKI